MDFPSGNQPLGEVLDSRGKGFSSCLGDERFPLSTFLGGRRGCEPVLCLPVCGNVPGTRIPPTLRFARVKSGAIVLLLDSTPDVYLEGGLSTFFEAPTFVIFCTSGLSKLQGRCTLSPPVSSGPSRSTCRPLGLVSLAPQDLAPAYDPASFLTLC